MGAKLFNTIPEAATSHRKRGKKLPSVSTPVSCRNKCKKLRGPTLNFPRRCEVQGQNYFLADNPKLKGPTPDAPTLNHKKGHKQSASNGTKGCTNSCLYHPTNFSANTNSTTKTTNIERTRSPYDTMIGQNSKKRTSNSFKYTFIPSSTRFK